MSQQQSDTGILQDKGEESRNDIEKRLEGLKLDDKGSDYFKILKRLDQTEPAKGTAVDEYISSKHDSSVDNRLNRQTMKKLVQMPLKKSFPTTVCKKTPL